MFLLFGLGVFNMAKTIYHIGTIHRLFKPIDTNNDLGEIKGADGQTYNFKLSDFDMSVQKRLKDNSNIARIEGWDVDFAPDKKGKIISGTIKQRDRIAGFD